jgi:tRNA threonylcarbamoyladenosine biosynthesis protein TsaE
LSENEMIEWGRALGRTLQPPVIVTLQGDLGSGKTTLARAICEGFGVHDSVTSPTFALVHEYHSPRAPVVHMDLYRLRGAAALRDLGVHELLASAALILIEWPELLEPLLGEEVVRLRLSHVPSDPAHRHVAVG